MEKGSGTQFTSVLHIDMNYTNEQSLEKKRCGNAIPVCSHWKKDW